MKNIKILVVFHKKSKLPQKNNIFVPIHAGRAVAEENYKIGKINHSEYDWLKNSMIGDNTGDNISIMNTSINEMTAIYWAWKNYEKLDNPDFIGLCHYRRYFKIKIKDLNKILKKYDFVKIEALQVSPGNNLYEQWQIENEKWADIGYLDKALDMCKQFDNTFGVNFEKFIKEETHVSWCNMFILSKEDFFNYCNFIFPVIFFLNDKLPQNTDRSLGMIAERLTAYYLHNLSLSKKAYGTVRIEEPLESSLLSKLFSVKCNEKHTIITILGIKIKIKKKEKFLLKFLA